ncbi:hypothetical protein FSP39_002467 [Pinctada imbricata]|uniref:Uncharacterized protein n=1 Tax=Pinctada imbricata TaxID=66713 RepID=A0AA88XPG6_PINIB|nr:hypothetical protein FSP39_002467 [Pinctada imbricata]
MGLASILGVVCQGCRKQFKLVNSPTLPESKRYDINVRAVWGSVSTGNGPSHLNELLGTMNSPGLSSTSFTSIEEEIGKWWANTLKDSMLKAGVEERRLAIERGSFHQEIPAITVITDGGWSKRTHKHSYNALGGVAIIIGKETGKLLFLGVRNKYCYICNTAASNKTEPRDHSCYKNWDSDSLSMESDIILEGFKEAESTHGVRYMRIIGDGDSSVYARIRDEIPVWGRYVVKEECSNHVTKCLRSNLEKLVSDNPLYKGKNHLTKSVRIRIVSAVRGSIRFRSKEMKDGKRSRDDAVRMLKHDIRNCVHHIFGYHSDCSDFCKAKGQQNTCTGKTTDTQDCDAEEGPSDIFEEQISHWKDGSTVDAQEESRLGTSIKFSDVEQFIISDVSVLLARIAEKADRLIGNTTTNLAECWMHIRCKFDGGKIYNLCFRGSWHGRCYAGGLRMNFGPEWSPIVWEKATGTEAGVYHRATYTRRRQQLKKANKHHQKSETKQKRWKRKMASFRQNSTKKAKKSYGPEALDVSADISTAELDKEKTGFYNKHVKVSTQQINQISASTLNQSQSGLWHTERKRRLTASNFGHIVKRRPSLPINKIVKNLLYMKFTGNRHTKNGLLQERSTIEEYKLKKAEEGENVIVESSGLIISKDHPYLAGSPDGIVTTSSGNTGLIEIKNLLHSKPINLHQASENSNFCLINKKGTLYLKENHIYYHQCQGLMNICNFEWIDFVVRTLNPYQMIIHRITRDKDFWNNTMLPKLHAFYFNCLLPELASPREGKSPGIREPGVWSPCCNKTYSCRVCHDENENHELVRKEVQNIVCLKCETKQEINKNCTNCDLLFGNYFCEICRLYDDTDKGQFHCGPCGLCRVGGRENFFHCQKCDLCLSTSLKDNHKCIEKASHNNCAVCLYDLHTSRMSTAIPPCGHLIHSNYSCPTCGQCMVDMKRVWEHLDNEIAQVRMPDEYKDYKVQILCKDCHKESRVLFHVVGLKCQHCGSYNTCRAAEPEGAEDPSSSELHGQTSQQSSSASAQGVEEQQTNGPYNEMMDD